MTTDEAKAIVRSSYPDAYLYKYGVGKKTGLTFVIVGDGMFNNSLGIIHKPYDHNLPNEIFEELVWRQAAQRIMANMVETLES